MTSLIFNSMDSARAAPAVTGTSLMTRYCVEVRDSDKNTVPDDFMLVAEWFQTSRRQHRQHPLVAPFTATRWCTSPTNYPPQMIPSLGCAVAGVLSRPWNEADWSESRRYVFARHPIAERSIDTTNGAILHDGGYHSGY